MLSHVHSASRSSKRRVRLLSAVVLGILLAAPAARAANPPSRPILFVHGFCGTPEDFAPLLPALRKQLNKTLYPAPDLYYVQYNSRGDATTFYVQDGARLSAVAESAIPSDTRFFSIQFYDPVGETSTPVDVAKISILNKAFEISQAIKHIAAITHIQDVIVVAHSMGGLDARAYMESMASAGACYDYQANTPNYSLSTCTPGAGDAKFAGDVGDLITVDAPHAGTPLDTFDLTPYEAYVGACIADESVDRAEMNPKIFGGPGLLEALNYSGQKLADVKPAKNSTPIEAVEDYFSDVTDSWDDFSGNFSGYSDDIVLLTSQSVKNNLPAAHSSAKLADVPVKYLSADEGISNTPGCWITVSEFGFDVTEPVLHFMACLAPQPDTQNAIAKEVIASTAGKLTSIAVDAALDGKPWKGAMDFKLSGPDGSAKGAAVPSVVDDLALGEYSVAYVSGGPKAVRPPSIAATPSATLQSGQWSATFTLSFASMNPAAVTDAAASITARGATLKGTVNPEGQPGQAFLEWSTNANLAAPKIGCKGGVLKNCPAITANFSIQDFSAAVSTAPSNTKVYYRMAFYDSANKSYAYGKILSFTTAK